uniref:Uncharacterized protein n=1 Tax=Aegilops tauschii subsp. strangulata TaxID=200361 RepID=A0A453NKC2_AEGTS
MWSQPDVLKEWTNSGERRGNVRFSHDAKKRPYLSRVEVKAVAEIIISRHFSSRGVKPVSFGLIVSAFYSNKIVYHHKFIMCQYLMILSSNLLKHVALLIFQTCLNMLLL